MAEHRLIVENGQAFGSHFYHVGDGYYYHLHRHDDFTGTMYFRCKTASCGGRAVFRFGEQFTDTQPHNHPSDVLYAEVNAARASIVNEARSMTYVSFSNIIRSEKRRYLVFSAAKSLAPWCLIQTKLFSCLIPLFLQNQQLDGTLPADLKKLAACHAES